MKIFKTKQVLELEDGEKAVLSGQVVTPASVQYYGFSVIAYALALSRERLFLQLISSTNPT